MLDRSSTSIQHRNATKGSLHLESKDTTRRMARPVLLLAGYAILSYSDWQVATTVASFVTGLRAYLGSQAIVALVSSFPEHITATRR